MFGQPWYRGYSNTHSSYNPYIYSPYQNPSPFDPTPRQTTRLDDTNQARARALAAAAQRARRAQYLPDEVEDDDDDWEYGQLGPRERAYLEAQRGRAILERRQEEEARAQALARQRELEEKEWQEALEKKQREDAETRLRLLEERKRQLRLKREEEARLMAAAAAAAAEEKMQAQTNVRHNSARGPDSGPPSTPSHSHKEDTSIPIHVRRDSTPSQPPYQSSIPTSRSPHTSRPSTPKSPPTSKHSLEEQNEAAIRIQNSYRAHLSYRTLKNILKEFETLRKDFVYPRTIDFQKPGGGEGHISVSAYRPPSDFDSEEIIEPMNVDGPDGKLDFTSTNFAVNSYSDVLDKLLMKLDGVESWGVKDIRDKRRTIVKDIEREASKLDRYCKQAWIDYLAKQAP